MPRDTSALTMNETRDRSLEDSPSCMKANIPISESTHLNAHDLEPFPASNILFSSCNKLTQKYYPEIWKHVRKSNPDLWIWLGDNAYSDGEDMNVKRQKYNEAREDEYYKTYGPIGLPKIPVTGIWDDHDFSSNDMGVEYTCPEMSQHEFCMHFNISSSDVRHPDHLPKEERQDGIYSSLILPQPSPYETPYVAGIHVINLDTRSQRSLLKTTRGDCSSFGGGHHKSDFLNRDQWDWLSKQLFQIKSEIKIISSSVQVLTPSDNARLERLCAYDGENGTFMKYVKDVGEDVNWMHGEDLYVEKWSDIPKARAKLLKMVQMSMNMEMAKAVIFISGNAHFGDIMAKRMPAHDKWGASQTMYEVVSSGIGQNPRYNYYPNANRVRLRTSDTRGDENYFNECKFPFYFDGQLQYDCILDSSDIKGRNFCFFNVDDNNIGINTDWGYCIPEEDEIVPRSDQRVSELGDQILDSCAQNYHHICASYNMYGGISIDWENGNIELSNYVPNMNDNAISTVTVHFEPEWKKPTNAPTPYPTVNPSPTIVFSPIRVIPFTQNPIIFSPTTSPTDINVYGPWVLEVLDLDEIFDTNSSKNVSIAGADTNVRPIKGGSDNITKIPPYRPPEGIPDEFVLIGLNLMLFVLFMGLYAIAMYYITNAGETEVYKWLTNEKTSECDIKASSTQESELSSTSQESDFEIRDEIEFRDGSLDFSKFEEIFE